MHMLIHVQPISQERDREWLLYNSDTKIFAVDLQRSRMQTHPEKNRWIITLLPSQHNRTTQREIAADQWLLNFYQHHQLL